MELISGNIFIRQTKLEKEGSSTTGHFHNFDHTTYVIRGSIKIEKLDSDGNVIGEVTKKSSDGYNWVLIKAGTAHRLTAVENNSAYHCIYSHINPQGEITQEYDGWTESYM